MSEENRWLTLALVCMAALIVLLYSVRFTPSYGQEHHGHPPQDMEIHRKFYSNWMMPDNRAVSCCHDEDCFPAFAKNVNGNWYARKTEEDEWTKIPASKVEYDRDTPDGRSHLCGRKYGFNGGNYFTVFCFIAGIGG
jgi:hypothetical protein